MRNEHRVATMLGVVAIALGLLLAPADAGAAKHRRHPPRRAHAPRMGVANQEAEADVETQPPSVTSPLAPVPGRLTTFRSRTVAQPGEAPSSVPAAPTVFARYLPAPWTSYDKPVYPPDPHLAVGRSQLVTANNLELTGWNRSGVRLWSYDLRNLFGCNDPMADPKVAYDPDTDRFYVAALSFNNATVRSDIRIAVSRTGNPTNGMPESWYTYDFDGREPGDWPLGVDFTCMGFDSQALYVTYNLFTLPFDFFPSFDHAEINVLPKAQILNGTPSCRRIDVADGTAFTLQPVSVGGGAGPGDVAYFAEIPFTSTTQVRLWALPSPLDAQSVLQSATVAVPNFGGGMNGAPQLGTTRTLSAFGEPRACNAVWADGRVWLSHGAGNPALGRSVVFYYGLDPHGFPFAPPTLYESGAIDGGSGVWTFDPALASNPRGDLCLVYMQSSATMFPDVRAVVRAAGGAGFSAPAIVQASPSFYTGPASDGSPYRWGDYFGAASDPVDSTFWVTGEWADSSDHTNGGWAQVIANLRTRGQATGWVPDGVALRTAPSAVQDPQIASDGAGGTFVAWDDKRGASVFSAFVEHVLADGTPDPRWPVGGLGMNGAAAVLGVPGIAADGSGGVYVALPTAGQAVLVRHVLATSEVAPGWPASGVSVPSTGGPWSIAADGSGGVLLAYTRNVIRLQALDAAGVPQWGSSGVAIGTSSAYPVAMTLDNAGGVIAAWSQGSPRTIHAQRVSPSGTLLWGADGVTVDAGIAPQLAGDGAGGAYAVYGRAGAGTGTDVFAARLRADGTLAPGWPRTLCNAPSAQSEYVAAADGAGGLLACWSDARVDPDGDIALQRLDGGGNALWTANGLLVCDVSGAQDLPALASDGAHGAIVAWRDARETGDVYFHHVMASGALDANLAANGQGVCTAAGEQGRPALVVTQGTAAVTLAWADARPDVNCEFACPGSIYVLREPFSIGSEDVDHEPGSGVPPPAGLELSRPQPNPASGVAVIRLGVPATLVGAAFELSVYDVLGRKVSTLARGKAAAGWRQVAWDRRDGAGRTVAPGTYFVRARVGEQEQVRSLVITR